jgi:hypothetical protein
MTPELPASPEVIRKDALKAYIIALAQDGAFRGIRDPLQVAARVAQTLAHDVPKAVGELFQFAAENAAQMGAERLGKALQGEIRRFLRKITD